MSYNHAVEEIVRRVGADQPNVISSPEDVEALLHTVNCTLCRIVPKTSAHKVVFEDSVWNNIQCGIELTDTGKALYAEIKSPLAA